MTMFDRLCAALSPTWAVLVIILATASMSSAFVTLDTSTPRASDSGEAAIPKPDSLGKDKLIEPPKAVPSPLRMQPGAQPSPSSPVSPVGSAIPAASEAPHYPVVLFLSADDYEVYAASGLVAALQTYGLQPDAIVAESRAALIAATWALGYKTESIESQILGEPKDAWVLPFSRKGNSRPASDFRQAETSPFNLTLASHSLQGDRGRWQEGALTEPSEFLHVSWLLARLAAGAPGGPVARLEKVPLPLALQVFDAETGTLRTLMSGDLQDLLKASLLPVPVARERSYLRPFSDGAQVSGHDAHFEQWPFRFDRIITMRLSPHMPRRMFGGNAPTWRDSIGHDYREGRRHRLDSLAQAGRVDYIDIVPDEKSASESDPVTWRDLGFQAALRHMDLLMKAMRGNQGGAHAKAGDALANRNNPGTGDGARPVQITIDPLASGGRELLLDILQQNPLTDSLASGQQAMNSVMATGFYSQLDVAWQADTPTEGEQWVFSAKEQSKLQLWGAPRLLLTHEALSLRAPQIMAGLSWSEPLFIPLKFEIIGDLGGRQPGWALQAFVQPLTPLSMRAGIRHWQTDMHHFETQARDYDYQVDRFGTGPFRMRERQSRLFLDFMPDGLLRLQGDVGMRHLRFGFKQDQVDSLRTLLEGVIEACLGCAKSGGGSRWSWMPSTHLRLRRAETVSEGQVKPLHDVFSVRETLKLPYAKVMAEYVRSNYSPRETDLYDLYTGPEIDALSFGDQFFFIAAKALHYGHARAEVLPRLGALQGRAAFGYVRHQGATLLADPQDKDQIYWEMNLSYPTPLGPIRLGLGRFDDYNTLVALQFGVNLSLVRALDDSRL
jgi:hypothetical protein